MKFVDLKFLKHLDLFENIEVCKIFEYKQNKLNSN